MIYQRTPGAPFTVDVRWRGIARIQQSTGTANRKRAEAIERTLAALRDAGRRDILNLIAERKLSLSDVHDDFLRNRELLEHRVARAHSPAIGDLLDAWFQWLQCPGTVSARTQSPFSPTTIKRYKQSWDKLLSAFPNGRDTQVSDITRGLVIDYRRQRKESGTSGGTINRDIVALYSFLGWVQAERGIAVQELGLVKEREPDGRDRWLETDEIAALRRALPEDWWPLFCLLINSGLRIGEAQGLQWRDINLREAQISVHARNRRLKTRSSSRSVPITATLLAAMKSLATDSRPSDPVFPGPYGDYRSARRVYLRACRRANISGATIHDLRHTFAVHAAKSGVPIPRLQRILGHATPAMTMRYMAHAPQNYFVEDAALIDRSLNAAPAPARLALVAG